MSDKLSALTKVANILKESLFYIVQQGASRSADISQLNEYVKQNILQSPFYISNGASPLAGEITFQDFNAQGTSTYLRVNLVNSLGIGTGSILSYAEVGDVIFLTPLDDYSKYYRLEVTGIAPSGSYLELQHTSTSLNTVFADEDKVVFSLLKKAGGTDILPLDNTFTGDNTFTKNVDFSEKTLERVAIIEMLNGSISTSLFGGMAIYGANGVSIVGAGGTDINVNILATTTMSNAQIDGGGDDTLIQKGWFLANIGSSPLGDTIVSSPLIGNYSINWNAATAWKLSINNAAVTITDSNLPALNKNKVITIYIAAGLDTDSIVLPSYWVKDVDSADFDGAKGNRITVECLSGGTGTEDVRYSITHITA